MVRIRHVFAALGAATFVVTSVPGCSGSDAAPGADGGDGPPRPSSCTNGTLDGDELGVDCGGSCAACTGGRCTGPSDCKSGTCQPDGQCAPDPGKTCGVGRAAPCADGARCELDADCTSDVCTAGTCAARSEAAHSDGRRNAGESGIDCGGAVRETKPCPQGQTCKDAADCLGACVSGTCGAAGSADGKKNGTETDVDCGGDGAPGCAAGKACGGDGDCAEAYCPDATPRVCVTPRADDGVKNGTETDVDCGGASGVKCATGKVCAVDGDCTSACNYAKLCVEAPSCRPRFGGDTCGAGEVPSATHESCCRTLEVPGYVAPFKPAGTKTYLDKYEITAGRMRAFIDEIDAKHGGNLKAWVQANRPAFWNAQWDLFLATGPNTDVIATLRGPDVSTTDANGANPGAPRNVGTAHVFGGPLYRYVHGHNCGVNAGSFGFPTYFYTKAQLDLQNANVAPADVQLERYNPFVGENAQIPAKEALDVKSMTCAPNLLFAAFCQWDGGQLATDEVLDFVTGTANNGNQTLGAASCTGARCPAVANIIASSDGAQISGQVAGTGIPYFFPYYPNDVRHEGVSRVGAPGRAPLDAVTLAPNVEPWMDLGGNLNEIVYDISSAGPAPGFQAFGMKYRGIGFNSARAQFGTTRVRDPEYKAGMAGARCMRFR